MQFICRTSANDGGTELCVQVKKKRVSKPRRLTCFVNLKGKYYLWGQIHILAFSVNQVPVCLTYSSVALAKHCQALGQVRGWGRQESLGKGGIVSVLLTWIYKTWTPLCLPVYFPSWAIGGELRAGELLCKTWVWGARLLSATSPGSQWAGDVF